MQLNSAEDHHTGGKPSTRNLSIEEYIEELENQQVYADAYIAHVGFSLFCINGKFVSESVDFPLP